MHNSRTRQVEFGFVGSGQGNDGYRVWMEQREAEMRQKARELGLPLGHLVEIWLKEGTLLKGRLLFRGEGNNWELVVERVGFGVGEIEACVRVD